MMMVGHLKQTIIRHQGIISIVLSWVKFYCPLSLSFAQQRRPVNNSIIDEYVQK